MTNVVTAVFDFESFVNSLTSNIASAPPSFISEPSPFCFVCKEHITELTENMATVTPQGLLCGACNTQDDF